MKTILKFLVLLIISPLIAAEKTPDSAPDNIIANPGAESLPFKSEVINRCSLDNLPRSLSIRQGKDVWLGYDLERGKLFKVWQAPAGKPGLIKTNFVTKSVGIAWYEDNSAETWQLRRDGKAVPLKIRYLGCSQREAHFELTWELRHDTGVLKLLERIPMDAASNTERVLRELRVESLATNETLLPPPPARELWKPSNNVSLSGREWHRFTLP